MNCSCIFSEYSGRHDEQRNLHHRATNIHGLSGPFYLEASVRRRILATVAMRRETRCGRADGLPRRPLQSHAAGAGRRDYETSVLVREDNTDDEQKQSVVH